MIALLVEGLVAGAAIDLLLMPTSNPELQHAALRVRTMWNWLTEDYGR